MKQLRIGIFVVLLTGCKEKTPLTTGLEGQPLPSIELLLADSITRFHTAQLPKGKPVVLFAFEPSCPYCRAQTKNLLQTPGIMNDVQIVMVSSAAFGDFKSFYNKYNLYQYPDVTAGIDLHYVFQEYFKIPEVPCMAIYDSDKKLKQVLIGYTRISSIRKVTDS